MSLFLQPIDLAVRFTHFDKSSITALKIKLQLNLHFKIKKIYKSNLLLIIA